MDTTASRTFEKRHMTWCKCQALRVVPSSFSQEQCDERIKHSAVLRGLSTGIDGMDLLTIFRETNAMSLGLPRYERSYTNKAWAYFAFQSETARDIAMDQTFTLRNRKLTWHLPEEVKRFCPK